MGTQLGSCAFWFSCQQLAKPALLVHQALGTCSMVTPGVIRLAGQCHQNRCLISVTFGIGLYVSAGADGAWRVSKFPFYVAAPVSRLRVVEIAATKSVSARSPIFGHLLATVAQTIFQCW